MQTSDEHKVATPENWRKGERVIVPPAAHIDEAKARMASGEYELVHMSVRTFTSAPKRYKSINRFIPN